MQRSCQVFCFIEFSSCQPVDKSLAILLPNTAVVINGANKAVVKFEKTWIKEEQKTPENPANPGNNQQIADKNTWEAIQSYNEERRIMVEHELNKAHKTMEQVYVLANNERGRSASQRR